MKKAVTSTLALSRRMLALSALGFLVGLASTFVAKRYIDAESIRDDAEGITARPHEVARCEAAPDEFVGRTASGAWLFAYDPSGTPSHPEAPPLLLRLDPRAPVGGYVVRRSGMLRTRGEVAFRAAERGRCAWFVAHRRTPRFGPEALLGGASLALIAMVATLFAVGRGVVRPLLRRIREVKDLATLVGSAGEGPPIPSAPRDELDDIVDALREAHLALWAERTALARSKAALEAHLSTTAHDLRTPIASLQLALERATALAGSAPAGRALRGAVLDAYYVGALVENLHLATRMRGLSLTELPIVDLGEVVRSTGTRLAVVARHAGVALEWATPDEPVWVNADPLALERGISNAIDNAIRHASAHVAVVLEIGRDGYELVVRDDGRGFDDEAKRHARSMGLEVRGIGSSGDVHAGISRARWGLTVLAEVANAIGASLTIETSTSGTLLRLTPRPKIG